MAPEMKLLVEKHIEEYAASHSRKDSLLYNNRCYTMYINPNQEKKDQYEVNRAYILNLFDRL